MAEEENLLEGTSKEKKSKALWAAGFIFGFLILMIVGVQVNKTMTANAIKEQQEYETWLENNCECLENERPKCQEGFELVNDWCNNETRGVFTYALGGCSKYDCEDGIHVYNLEEEKWENQN